MLKKLARTLGLASLLLSATTQALPIVQADAFTEGDNKAALETSTGLVWMDFGVNSHRTFSDVVSSLDTDYAGWRLPTIAEVDHLWRSLFEELPEWKSFHPDSGFLNTTLHDDYFNTIADVFGVSWNEGSVTHVDAYGNLDSWLTKTLFSTFSDGDGLNGLIQILIPYDDIHPNEVVYGMSRSFDNSSYYGALLVKDTGVSVPEPSSGLLAVLAIFILTVRRLSFRR